MNNRNFNQLLSELKDILPPDIAPLDSEIFQKILLELALVEVSNRQTAFLPIDDKNCQFKLFDLQIEDVTKFSNFLKKHNITAIIEQESDYDMIIAECIAELKETATPEEFESEVKKLREMYPPGLEVDYNFQLSIDDVFDKLLPLFKAEIQRINTTSPEKLDTYKEASKNSIPLQFGNENEGIPPELMQLYQISMIAPQVIAGADQVESHCDKPETKESLQKIFSKLKNLMQQEQDGLNAAFTPDDIRTTQPEYFGEHSVEIDGCYKEYKDLVKTHEDLKQNAEAINFKATFKEYRNLENTMAYNSLAKIGALMFSALCLDDKDLDKNAELENNNNNNKLFKM